MTTGRCPRALDPRRRCEDARPPGVAVAAGPADRRRAARDLVEASATKSTPTDIVTVMDTARGGPHPRSRCSRSAPTTAFLGEEGGDQRGTSGITWVVDPIDGTVNYLYDIPAYAVSVAAVVGDPKTPGEWQVLAGAVADPALATRLPRGGAAPAPTSTGGTSRPRPGRTPSGGRLGRRRCPARWSAPASATRRSGRRRQGQCCSRCSRRSATSAGSAVPPSTSARWPAGGSTASTSAGSTRGTWPPAG